jgi:hypothetical protein
LKYRHELLVGERLLPDLDDVDAAPDCPVEKPG